MPPRIVNRRSRSCSTLQWLVRIVDSARQNRRKDRVPLAINDRVVTREGLISARWPIVPLPGSTGPLYWVVSSLNSVNFNFRPPMQSSRTMPCFSGIRGEPWTDATVHSLEERAGPTERNSFISFPFPITARLLYPRSPLRLQKAKKRRINFALFSRLGPY